MCKIKAAQRSGQLVFLQWVAVLAELMIEKLRNKMEELIISGFSVLKTIILLPDKLFFRINLKVVAKINDFVGGVFPIRC